MIETITLDTRKSESPGSKLRISPLRRGERNNVTLTVSVRQDRRPYDLAGMTARLVWQAADSKLVGPVPMEVTDQAAGTVRCTLPDACYSAVGMARAYIELRRGAELVDTTDEMLIEVLDCIDADGEQAEEYTPLLGELQDAIAAARASEVRGATAVTLETGNPATATFRDNIIEIGVPKGERGAKGDNGDPFTYADFTEAQILELQRPATEAAADAQAAIAEVKATEAKLYTVAENILVGSETGTVAHVEDAFAGATLRKITVEGACKQDGTPSPDNPVPIQVVENPVLWVTGMNMFDISKLEVNPNKPYGMKISAEDGYIIIQGTVSGVGISRPSFSLGWYADNSLSGKGLNISAFGAPSTVEAYGLRTANETQIAIVTSVRNGDKVDWKIQIAVSKGEQKEYKPYTSQTLTLTLPAEHPYLAKLPDGTADEIVVDRDGNVELVARVCRDDNVRNVNYISVGKFYELSVKIPAFANASSQTSGCAICSAIQSLSYNTTGIYRTWTGVYVKDTSGRTKEEIQAEVDKNAPLTVFAPIPETRYSLGKIEMPKAQDSIVNVWTDAEVTPRTGIEYVRDVNIVVANLESAIASIS